jgi:hypothetical protein
MQYYLHDGREQYGPFTLDELRANSLLTSTSMIWCEGMTEWKRASEMEVLKNIFSTRPPAFPLTAAPSSSPPQLPIAKQGPSKSRYSSWKTLAIIILVVIVAYAGYGIYDKQQTEKSTRDASETARHYVRDNIRSYVQAGNSSYTTYGLGGIVGLNIVISNQSDYMLDNVRVMIRYIKANGETWKEEPLDFALVPPRQKMTLRAPDSDRGTSIDYKIVEIKSTALGL